MKICTTIAYLILCAIPIYGVQKSPVYDFKPDLEPMEALEDVSQTRQRLLYDVNGIKLKKIKDPKEGLYSLLNVGIAHTPLVGISNMIGVEMGYDFIIAKIHSIRVFGFFDRTNHGGFADFEFNANKSSQMQIYRGGFSMEYRIYITQHIGFRVRLLSFGAHTFASTDNAATPTLRIARTKWFYPTFAFGPIFVYGKHHELFIGYDLLDYEKQRGMSVNYLKYSFRF